MAGIPVNDLGPMIGMPYAGSSGQTAPPKSAAESFESVWNGQVERKTQPKDPGESMKKQNTLTEKKSDSERPVKEQEPEKVAEDREVQENSFAKTNENHVDQTQEDTIGDVKDVETLTEPENLEEVMEILGAALTELVVQIADTFEITPEAVEEELTSLGMQTVELTSPDKLGELLLHVGEAEGVTSLLTDETLYQDYKTLMAAQEEMVASVNDSLSEQGLETEVSKVVEWVMSGVENNLVEVPTEDMPITNETEMDSDTDTDADAATELVRPEDSRDESKETTPVMGEPIRTQAKTEAERTDDGQSEQEHRGRREHTNEKVISHTYQEIRNDSFRAEEISTTSQTSSAWDADTQNIMRQIMDYMRVQLKPDMSNLEMQLHPASLGTVQVQVASKGGVVTAQFFTQNETVKAALESQMIQLKESFAQQGVKVEAIEVAVQTHEFERNLDQGQNRQSGQEEPSRRNRTRRIDLNGSLSLEDLENLEDEERLAADMMAANGNSVDYMA